MPPLRPLDQSSKLKNVLYEIRGSALDEVVRLEAEGHTILRLNTGNPAAFGFEAPHQIVRDVIAAIPHAHGYTDSRGILSARRAVVRRLEKAALKVDYVECVDAETLSPSRRLGPGAAVLVAAFAGRTRLIDNRIF
jgi:hypothetical protein